MNERLILLIAARAIAVILLLVLVTLAGCGSARRGEPIAGPMQLDDPSVQRGKQLFDTHCYKCHAQGEGGLGPALNDKPLPRFLMHFQTRHGLGTMPSFPEQQIGDRELEDILNYIVALRQHGK